VVGQTISHYRIVSQLGAGGMGVVYAAEDARLSRQVALKFVSTELAHDDSTIDRLKAEARTTSALNHPNICTIYDIDDHDGRPFIVMEILKGRTLRERLADGPLKIHETVDIAIQVSDALVAAHSRGIIHRDIKPANLFLVEQGPVKVLDFGLAKSVSAPPTEELTTLPTADLTAVGMTVGTVAYMSPEQVGGDQLDRRTDLFSLGVVLYECVTNRQPFQGKTSAVILASILHQQPTPPITLNANVPPGLQDVVQKCLEKDRELRYQDAEGLRADLKRVRRDLESSAFRSARKGLSDALAADAAGQSAVAPVASERRESGASVPVPAARKRGLLVGVGAAAAVVIAAGAALIVYNQPSAPPDALPQNAQASPPPSTPAAPSAVPPPSVDVARGRSDARAASPRFDAAIIEGNRLLAAGNADGATRALNVARSIDPQSPAVADLSARIVEFYKSAAARRPASEVVRGAASPPPSAPAQASPPTAQAAARAPEPAPAAAPANAPSPAPRPPAPEVSAVAAPLPGATLPSRPEPVERRPTPAAAPAPQAEDDDGMIRRVIATYARAIETKDLALYRSVKPNLSAAEQKTIEDGFRAVTSQRVTINIQSIEHRGQDAIVRLRRQDVIQAGGRQQTADSQQSITLVRAASGWVIREIGR
jgi:predicted Ser/Thr protein kinase